MRAPSTRPCSAASEALQTNRRDLPFALVLLRMHAASQALTLAAAAGEPWHWLDAAQRAGFPRRRRGWQTRCWHPSNPRLVQDLAQTLAAGIAWPSGDWQEAPRQAILLPIRPSGDAGREGVLVVGLSPHRLPEGSYADFLQLVAQQLSAAIGHAEAYELQRHKADELARLDRAKTQFFSNISHEFRTPLTLMLGPLHDASRRRRPAAARSKNGWSWWSAMRGAWPSLSTRCWSSRASRLVV